MQKIAVITARGGSKSIPKKNLVSLAGKPLIAHTIIAAKQTECFDRILVTTEDQEIARTAQNYGAEIIERPRDLAQDHSTSLSAVLHCLQAAKVDDPDSIVVLLQPTSPLRRSEHIREALQQFEKLRAESCISVFSVGHSPFKCFIVTSEGHLKGLISNEAPFTPRQSLPEAYKANGAIYIVRLSSFLKQRSFLLDPCCPYIMSEEESLDIDSSDDLQIAEDRLKRREVKKGAEDGI